MNSLTVSRAQNPASVPKVLNRANWRPLYWALAGLILFVLQILSGTQAPFAALVFVFGVLSYLTIKTVGGIDTLIGIMVAEFAGQHVLISQVAKVAFWQSADAKLLCPIETMEVYVIGMAALWLGALASNRTGAGRRRPLFVSDINIQHLFWLAVVTTAVSFLRSAALIAAGIQANATVAPTAGGWVGPVNIINFLPSLAIACGTAYTIRATAGRRSLGLLNGIMLLFTFGYGIIVATRIITIEGFIVYVVTCVAFRFRFRPRHFLQFSAALLFAETFLFPFALFARSFVHRSDWQTNTAVALKFLGEAIQNPNMLKAYQEKKIKHPPRYIYYDREIPDLDRYSLIVSEDAIIHATLLEGTIGMTTITPGFLMLSPRMFLPDKPFVVANNLLAHRAPGLVGKNDHSTGITTGFMADSFSSYAWLGAFVIPFLIAFSCFTVYRLIIVNKIWGNVWALGLLVKWPWFFSEGTIETEIINIFQGALVVIFTFGLVRLFARSLEHFQLSGRLRQFFVSRASRRVRYHQ